MLTTNLTNQLVKLIRRSLLQLPWLVACGGCLPLLANEGSTWFSQAIGQSVSVKVSRPTQPLTDSNGKYMTVVYLEHLSVPKIGQNPIGEDVASLLDEGYQVVELDYAGHERAVSPHLNQDIMAINDALNKGAFAGLSNCSPIRSYILFEGYRLARDIAYFKDDPSVYNWPGEPYVEGDSLYLDIVYPANPVKPVPLVLSFSYSNSYAEVKNGELTGNKCHQRLFLGYTLSMFDDTFLEGAPARGMAWAIADHPKYCDWGQGKPAGGPNKAYGSFQTNPDAVQKVKSAIRTVRSKANDLGLSGKIALYGFSRGSTAASLAVGDDYVRVFERAGLHTERSSRIQAALLGPGVFDYTIVYEHSNDGDGNLENRCPLVWGALDDSRELWESMGAVALVRSQASAPVCFFYNTSDEPYYQHQIAHFKETLRQKQVETDEIVDYGHGHSVPKDSASLCRMYDFLDRHLRPDDATSKR